MDKKQQLYTINYEDLPCGLIPGAYTSIPQKVFHSNFYISWPHLFFPNNFIEINESTDLERKYLFTFRGSCRNKLRKNIIKLFSSTEGVIVTDIDRWFNHDKQEQLDYRNEILNSNFVLCPKGIADYTHRIIEVMSLGRVPVILADQWQPFSIPEDNYYIRVAEKNVKKIKDILINKLDHYDVYQHSVRHVFNKYFSIDNRMINLFNKVISLANENPFHVNYSFLSNRLNSKDFYKDNGWLLHQRVMKKIKLKLGFS